MTSNPIRMAIIGCGRYDHPDGSKGSQAHFMMFGFHWLAADVRVVAAADINPENLALFCDEHGIPGRYLDYRQMLEEVRPDAVAITTWPRLHAEMTIAAAKTGVKWVHCEKPMATTYGDAQAMVRICDEQGTLLTIDHQYRYMSSFPVAKRLLDQGAIGKLLRVETFTRNLFDMGTHYFDLMLWYNNQEPVEWVMGQIDATDGPTIFGDALEGQGFSYFRWRNGVYGMMFTGIDRDDGVEHRLYGTDGVIEVGVKDGPDVRYWNRDSRPEWIVPPLDPYLPIPDSFWSHWTAGRRHALSMAKLTVDAIDAYKSGREPMCSGRNALQGDELIFATYESARRRARVDLPLQIEDNPYLAMLKAGLLPVRK